jgi:hypothetical protein
MQHLHAALASSCAHVLLNSCSSTLLQPPAPALPVLDALELALNLHAVQAVRHVDQRRPFVPHLDGADLAQVARLAQQREAVHAAACKGALALGQRLRRHSVCAQYLDVELQVQQGQPGWAGASCSSALAAVASYVSSMSMSWAAAGQQVTVSTV